MALTFTTCGGRVYYRMVFTSAFLSGEPPGSPPCFLFQHEQPPLRDVVRIANERRDWEFLRRAGRLEQLEAGLVRQTVGLALVHFFGRPDQVLPCVFAAARTRHDMVQAALLRPQHAASVLAAVGV